MINHVMCQLKNTTIQFIPGTWAVLQHHKHLPFNVSVNSKDFSTSVTTYVFPSCAVLNNSLEQFQQPWQMS